MARVLCTDILGNPHEVDESELIETTRVYGIYIQDQTVLMAKDWIGESWGLPGGGVDEGESEEQALIREFKEEVGVQVSGPFEIVDTIYGLFYPIDLKEGWKTTRKFYTVTSLEGKLRYSGNGEDTSEVRFISKDELGRVIIQPEVKAILKKVFEI